MKKIATIDEFLQRHEDVYGYSQFTIDYIEEARESIEEYRDKPEMSEADFLHALHYDADNVFNIIRPDLPDAVFYKQLRLLLRQLADKADAQTRQTRRASKASWN